MADPIGLVGLVASVLQLVNIVAQIRGYIKNFHDAPEDQRQLLLEIESLEPFVKELEKRIKNTQAAGLTNGLQELETPLIQLKGTMEQLTKKLDSTGISKVSNRVVWPLWGKEDIEEGLNTIERFKSLLSAWLGMDIWSDFTEEQRTDHSYIMRSVKDLAHEYRVAHNEMISTLKDTAEEQSIDHTYIAKSVRDVARNQERYHDSEERQKILDWYSPLNFFLRQADVFSAWQPGTGGWLLDAGLFKEWKSGSGKTLWCRGIPGAGKTVLASIVVENLRTEQNTGVAVLYLNHKETETQSPSNLLAALWRQLVFGKPIPPVVHHLYAKHHEQRTRPSLEDTYSILCSIISAHPSIFIIVDALDEYPEELRDILLGHLSVLSPTRPHIKINHIMMDSALETMEIRATADDIRRHITAEIAKSSRLSKHVTNCLGLREEIETTIVRRSDGMFLLAKFHIDSLTTKHTIKAVRDALTNMPEDLNYTYGDIMQRINRQSEDDKSLARRTLSWISNVKRPLRPAELTEALAVELGATQLDPYNLLDIDTILSVCAGLVIVDDADDLVRLIHYTTQDYLERVQADGFPRAQTEIASVCITYLSFKVFSPKKHDHNNHLFPKSFLDYSVDYCLMHARGQPESDIRHLILSFLENCSSWRKIWNWRHSFEKIPPSATPLFIATVFRLEHICRYLIKEKGVGGLLQEASLEGLTDVVQILLENGANPDANEGEYDSALQATSVNGHDDILHVLLAHGADIHLCGRRYGTALQMAAFFDHRTSARLLIDRGANINVEAGRYGTALYAAVTQGNKEMVHLLLEHGAAVHQEGGHYGTALCVSIYRGFDVIARVLIEHGANLNEETTMDNRATRMLHRAISMGHEDIIGLLLEHSTPVDWKGASGNSLDVALQCRRYEIADLLIAHGALGTQFDTLLHFAAVSEGHGDVVRILFGVFTERDKCAFTKIEEEFARYTDLANGFQDITYYLIQHRANAAKIIAIEGHLSTVLFTAVLKGHLDGTRLLLEHGACALSFTLYQSDFATTRFLIEHGANVNEPGCMGNPLSIASSQGHNEILRLIEHGTDISAQCRQYICAFRAASSASRKEIVSLLIEHGADVNARGGEYGSALQGASRAGHKDIVSLLIKHGADVSAQGGQYGTALQAASSAGHKDIVKVLIAHGADVNVPGGRYGSALQGASGAGHKDIVSLLIEHGADVNAHGGRYCSALQRASRAGHRDIVNLLIDHGAAFNKKGKGLSIHRRRRIHRRAERRIRVLNEARETRELAYSSRLAAGGDHREEELYSCIKYTSSPDALLRKKHQLELAQEQHPPQHKLHRHGARICVRGRTCKLCIEHGCRGSTTEGTCERSGSAAGWGEKFDAYQYEALEAATRVEEARRAVGGAWRGGRSEVESSNVSKITSNSDNWTVVRIHSIKLDSGCTKEIWRCRGTRFKTQRGIPFPVLVVHGGVLLPLELSKHPQNIHSKFIVLVLRTRTPRPTAVLKMFEYIDIFVFDRPEHTLRIRGKPSEADFQAMLEVTKEADNLAKRQGMPGAALVMTDIRTSDGASGLLRGTPVLLRPSALAKAKDGNSDWETPIKHIINEGLSIKESFRAQEIAGTLPPPLA
ncbi:ankyrin repeat-containing domain protein [Mycena latifolia]|nr:ankyrin repeat-containing domain protein [Mycena latifolia]